MKVIDLLNKIANGERPKNILYKDKLYYWDKNVGNYIFNEDKNVSINWDYVAMYSLDDEVEIIEEDKKIEKLYIRDRANDILIGKNEKITYATDSLVSKELALKINEIIDKLNEMEKE